MRPELRARHRLALPSLCLSALSALASGCLVADPPQYEEPATTPVFLDVAAAIPIVGRVIVETDLPVTIDFDIPIRSEDNGDEVAFGLLQDFGFPERTKEVFCYRATVAPGTFDETDRAVRFRAQASEATEGCYQLTLLVSHENNWDGLRCRPDLIKGVGDTSMITWWLNVVPPGRNPNDLLNCPSPSEIQP
ncbi:MAG: hypothetical protein M3020_19360 [Myxococcota bacterium]|jgi:hypothetical protein|nr:hypothetical protein [Myxococcota bacterium]